MSFIKPAISIFSKNRLYNRYYHESLPVIHLNIYFKIEALYSDENPNI